MVADKTPRPTPEAPPRSEAEAQPKSEAEAREDLGKLDEDLRKGRMEYLKTLDPQLPGAVEQWKSQFGFIESIHICRQIFIYRGLLRGEYLEVAGKSADEYKAEHIIASKGLLYPEIPMQDWIAKPAGLPSALAKLISTLSGFEPSDPMPVRL